MLVAWYLGARFDLMFSDLKTQFLQLWEFIRRPDGPGAKAARASQDAFEAAKGHSEL